MFFYVVTVLNSIVAFRNYKQIKPTNQVMRMPHSADSHYRPKNHPASHILYI